MATDAKLMRQQYLVSRQSVARLRQMSRAQKVPMSELARRAIEAYTQGAPLSETEEEAAARGLLQEIHTQVSTTLERIDQGLKELEDRERALADGSFQDQVRRETRHWIDTHPKQMSAIAELFAPETA